MASSKRAARGTLSRLTLTILAGVAVLSAVVTSRAQQGEWGGGQTAAPGSTIVIDSAAENPAAGNATMSAPAAPANNDAVARAMLADHFIVLARQQLAGGGNVRPDQLTRCRILLDQALTVNPDDADGWMLRKEVAQLETDLVGQFNALKEYVRLRPGEDAAQLDLILLSANSQSTVEQRIHAANGVLESVGGRSLSAAVKSRLHSYIAQQAAELGDQETFGDELKKAVELDRSNSQAARLMYELAVARQAAPQSVGATLLHVLNVNPLDTTSRRVLADLLMTQNAFAAAAQQYLVVRMLGLPGADEQFVYNWVVCLIATGESQKALEMIDGLEAALMEVDNTSRLPFQLETVRLALHEHMGARAAADASFRRLRDYYLQRVERGDDQAAVTLSFLTAAFSANLSEPFARAVQEFVTRHPDNVAAQRTLGWVKLRNGDFEAAGQLFGAVAEQDVLALVGLARCSLHGDSDLRTGYLRRAVAMAPNSLAGVLALLDLTRSGLSAEPTPSGASIAGVLAQLPASIVAPLPGQTPWTQVRLQLPQDRFDFLEPITALVSMTNRSNLALELAPGGTLPTNLVVYQTPWQTDAQALKVAPLVVSLRRQIMLGAGESITVPVRLDRGDLGHLLSYNSTPEVAFSVAAVLDPQVKADGTLGSGPLGAIDMPHLLTRTGERPTMTAVSRWTTALEAGPAPAEQLRLLARLTPLCSLLAQEPARKSDLDRITGIINQQAASMSANSLAWTVSFAPGGAAGRKLLAGVHEAAQRSSDPLVQTAYLATQIAAANDPILAAALRSNDANVSAYAQALRTALTGGQ